MDRCSNTRTLAVLVAGGLALSCAGCSVLFSRGPKVDPDKMVAPAAELDCTDHPWWAFIDAGMVFAGATALIIPAATETGAWASEFKPYAISPGVGIGVGIAMAVAGATSAIYGFTVLNQCAKAHRRQQELQAGLGSKPLNRKVPRRTARPPAPPGAAGFVFGELMDEAAATCVGAGHRWSEAEGAARCSGTPSGEFRGASAQIALTDGRVSAVVLVIDSPEGAAGLAGALRETEAALVRLYGKPGQRRFVIPDECKAQEALLGCVVDGKATVRASWSLPDGRSVTLSIAGEPPPATIRVRIIPKPPEP